MIRTTSKGHVIRLLSLYECCNPLTDLHHQVSSGRILQPICKVPAIPHEQLLAGRNWLDGVKIDVHSILTSSQVLLLDRMGWIYIAHPVALFLVKSINEVMKLTTRIYLQKERRYTLLKRYNKSCKRSQLKKTEKY